MLEYAHIIKEFFAMTERKCIGIFEKEFPVGTLAWHDKYQYCQVMMVDKNEREIKAVRLGLSGPVFKTYRVYVKELSALTERMKHIVKSMGVDFIAEKIES